ncbi:MAG: biopolymer transporter ExbD [Pirellulaceae bacterium]|nr:biopolymer transporter ExbD [Planctomycetales bacterium]
MRVRRRGEGIQEGDLTPMIDMTFQLIAFFMVLINFNQSEQNEKIQLPESTLAKPPDAPLETPITLHLTKEGRVILGGQEVAIEGIGPLLTTERNSIMLQNKPVSDATVIIRAHRDAQTGRVQNLIQECQKNKFEKFALRAKEDVGN